MKLVASTVTVKWTADKTERQVLGVKRNIQVSQPWCQPSVNEQKEQRAMERPPEDSVYSLMLSLSLDSLEVNM